MNRTLTFPLDVWHHIFSYACTDGGRTGAALALTSTYFRTISASFRFHSLTLTRVDQVSHFLLCLERIKRSSIVTDLDDRRRLGGMPNTRHLLLSFLPADGGNPAPARPSREWSEYSRNRHKAREQLDEDERAARDAKRIWDRQFEYVIRGLLELVRPTLETLVVLQSTELALPYVGGSSGTGVLVFPVLRELSLLADDRMFVRPEGLWVGPGQRDSDAPPGTLASTLFPALTHLHVVYEGVKEHPWEKTLPMWGKMAPAVTHLRISQASKVVEEMTTTSFGPARAPASGAPDGRTAVAFPRLVRVVVQPFVREPVRGHDEVERLRTLSKARSRGPTVVTMRGRWYRAGYWKDRLAWDWEDRMMGKAGSWAEREEDEGEWAYERRKRAEVAAGKARKREAGWAVAGRVVSMIRLDKNHKYPRE